MAIVFEAADQIGVSRSRSVDATFLTFFIRRFPDAHDVAPVLMIAIADQQRDRRSDRLTAAHTAEHFGFVALDLHARPASVTELPPRHVIGDRSAVESDPGRHSAHRYSERWPV